MTPYLLVAAFALGVGAGVWPTWKIQSTRLEAANLAIERTAAAAAIEQEKADWRAKVAQRAADDAVTALSMATNEIEVLQHEIDTKLKSVASPTRACVSAPASRVLRNRSDSQRAAESRDPVPPAPAVPAADPVPAAGYVSELAVTQWANQILSQYQLGLATHRELAGIVRTLPCVKEQP